jgi:hypothetical protein
MFSAEKWPTLWRALSAIKELQTAWEAKQIIQNMQNTKLQSMMDL